MRPYIVTCKKWNNFFSASARHIDPTISCPPIHLIAGRSPSRTRASSSAAQSQLSFARSLSQAARPLTFSRVRRCRMMTGRFLCLPSRRGRLL